MTTITGLQPPNPYGRVALKVPVSAHPAEDAANHAVSASSSYSPDWMQADSAVGIYGAKGEPVKLPLSNPPANEPFKPDGAVVDGISVSS